MSNQPSNRPEVDWIVHGWVKERWLKNSGRKIDAVFGGIVVRIDSRRGDDPFILVPRTSDFLEVVVHLEGARIADIGRKIVALDSHRAVVEPLLRVADLVGDGIQLGQCLPAGLR